ncbi:MAG: hypothetical protein AAF483_05060 [Planctomycetota bacterium]
MSSIAPDLGNASSSSVPDSVGLARETRQGLRRFARRRRLLGVVRALAWILVVAIVALLLAVIIDSFVVHPAARIFASGVFYGSTVIAAIVYCLHFRRAAPLEEEAKHFENLAPELQDKLLSAVELASRSNAAESGSVVGSKAFQAELQKDVGARIERFDPRQLLRWATVRRSLLYGVAMVVLLAGMCVLPMLHMPQRIARTMLPFANLGRITNIEILIDLPQPNSQLMPRGDVIAIRARVLGPEPRQVRLETRSAEGTLAPQEMASLNLQEAAENIAGESTEVSFFESTLAVNEEYLDYRIVSGNATTAWHRLTTRTRPSIEEFEITVRLPSYADAEPMHFHSERGDVSALMGSQVEIAVRTDQVMSAAEIVWLEGGVAVDTSKMEFDSERKLYAGSFVAESDRDFRISLTAAESGFKNEFSASYELLVVEDLEPIVRWNAPLRSEITAGVSEILSWSVNVRDELDFESLEQQYRINSGEWRKGKLTVAADVFVLPDEDRPWETQYKHDWQLDLLPLDLKAGDYLEMKVLATDRKDQVGESDVRRVYLSSTEIDLTEPAADQARRELADELERLSSDLGDQLNERLDSKDKKDWTREEASQAVEDTKKGFKAHLSKLQELQTEATKQASDAVSSVELRMVGEMISQLKHETMGGLDQLVAAEETGQVRRNVKSIRDEVKQLASAMRNFVTHDIARKHMDVMKQVSQAERQIAESPNRNNHEVIARQQQALVKQLREVVEDIQKTTAHVSEGSQHRYQTFGDQLGNFVEGMARQAESRQGPALASQAAGHAENLERRSLLSYVDGDIYERQKKSMEWLNLNVKSVGDLIHEEANSSLASTESGRRLLDQLDERRSQRRASESADRDFPRDLGQAKRALAELMIGATDEERREEMKKLESAMQVLEMASELSDSSEMLSELYRNERYRFKESVVSTHNPRLLENFRIRIQQAAERANDSGIPGDITNSIQKLTWDKPAQEANRLIPSRRWESSEPKSAESSLRQLSADLQAVQAQVAPLVEEARSILDDAAPTISELAKKAADQTRELSEKTEKLSDEVTEQSEEATQVDMEQLQEQKDSLQSPLDELREALVDRAETHDLLDSEELDQARADDAGLQIVDRAKEQAESSLDKAAEAENTQQQQQALEDAAEEQMDAAQALEQLADIFKPQSESNQQLGQQNPQDAMQQLSDAAQALDQQELDANPVFDEAQQLAEMAESNPQSLLEMLEEELPSDQAMQDSMSDIAKATAEKAKQDLEQAADKQSQLENAIENSDPRLEAQKKLLSKDLELAKDQANNLRNTLLKEAKNAATLGKENEVAKELSNAAKSLEDVSAKGSQRPDKSTMQEMQDNAKDLANALREASEKLAQAQQDLSAAKENQIHEEGADLNNRRQDAKARQQRIKQQEEQAQRQMERTANQNLRLAETSLRQAANRVTQEKRQLERREAQAKKSNNPEAMQAQLDYQRGRIATAQANEQVQRELRDAMKAREQQAKQRVSATQKRQTPKLNSPNPNAELAADLAQQSSQRANELAQKLDDWSKKDTQNAEATSSQLSSAAKKQEDIQSSVSGAADDLQRAGRHEERLQNQQASQGLAAVAEQADSVAEGELQQAQEAMQQAADQGKQSDSPARQANAEKTAAATSSSEAGENAIRETAASLEDLLSQNSDRADSADGQASEANTGQPNANQQANEQSGTQQQASQEQSPTSQKPSGNAPPPNATAQQNSGSPQNSQSSQNTPQSQGGQSSQPTNPSPNASPLSQLSSSQKAQLLDELDQQVFNDLNLGPQDNNAQNPMQSGSSQPAPSTLAEAAKQLAMQLSRSQMPPQGPPPPDIGMATEANLANVDPQAPTEVRVMEVQRVNGDWGELREQRVEGAVETKRSKMAPHIRAQVDAYFRSLAGEEAP